MHAKTPLQQFLYIKLNIVICYLINLTHVVQWCNFHRCFQNKQNETTVILLFYKLLLIFLAFNDNIAQTANYLYNCMVPEKSLQQNQPFWDLKKKPKHLQHISIVSFTKYSFSKIERNKNTNKGKHWTIKAPYMNRR